MNLERADDNFTFTPRATQLAEKINRQFLSMMNETLKDGSCPLLPDPDTGMIDNYPPVDIETDRELRGATGLYLSLKKTTQGFEQNYWIEARTAQEAGLHAMDSPSPVIMCKAEELSVKKYFNIMQFSESRMEILERTAGRRQENKTKRLRIMQSRLGEAWDKNGVPADYVPSSRISDHGHFGFRKLGRKPITIRSPDVKEYMKLYFKSIDEKVPVYVDSGTAEAFRQEALRLLRQKKVFHRTLPSGVKEERRVNSFKALMGEALKEERESRDVSRGGKKSEPLSAQRHSGLVFMEMER